MVGYLKTQMTMFSIKTSKCLVDEPCELATVFQFTTQPVHRHGRTRSGSGFAKKKVYTEQDVNIHLREGGETVQHRPLLPAGGDPLHEP